MRRKPQQIVRSPVIRYHKKRDGWLRLEPSGEGEYISTWKLIYRLLFRWRIVTAEESLR